MSQDITVYVPTRGNRDRILATVAQLEGAQVKLLVTDLPVLPPLPNNVEVILHGTRAEYNIANKRNFAVQDAIQRGLAYCIQIDDDLYCKGKRMTFAAQQLVNTLTAYPWLGEVTAASANTFATSVPQPISHPFTIKGCGAMFIGLNLEAMGYTSGYRSHISEDNDISAQLWTAGWPVASVPTAVYSHIRPRTKQTAGVGGFPLQEINELTLKSTQALDGYPAIRKISTKMDKLGFVRMTVYWNWKYLLGVVTSLGVKYEDSKRSNKKE